MFTATASRRVLPAMRPGVAVGSIAGAVVAAFVAVLALRSTHTAIDVGAPALLGGVAVWMFFSERYHVTLAVLALYVGVFDGFLKLKTGSSVATLGRDVLLYAIAAGALVRFALAHRPARLPKLTLVVVAWIVICLAQVFNPVVPSITHALTGVRQHIEFVPLFFLGYFVMRSKRRLMGLFWLMVVIAAANGVVGLLQSHLTPAQLAAWGPGYAQLVNGTALVGARTYADAAGTLLVRPPALGSDFGFGGTVAAMALPAVLAIAVAGGRQLRYMPVLAVGTVLAVVGLVTSQSRTAIVTAVVGVVFFLLLTVTSRRGVVALLVSAILALVTYLGVTAVFAGVTSGPNRYSSIAPTKVISTAVAYRQNTLSEIPKYIVDYPLGDGIGSSGPAGGSSVGGSDTSSLDAESEPTFLIIELGIPGLITMFALVLYAIRMGLGLRVVADRRLQCALAALTAVLIEIFVTWFVGIDTANSPTAPFMWLSLGTLAFWYAELRRGRVVPRSSRVRASLSTR